MYFIIIQVYSLDDHSAFPLELSHLARFVASAVGFHCYSPEAAIVNFYPVGSTLSGHTDHSEFDHESPIISFRLEIIPTTLLRCYKV